MSSNTVASEASAIFPETQGANTRKRDQKKDKKLEHQVTLKMAK